MEALSSNLPAWLNNFIYNEVGAKENCDWRKARQNLNNSHAENIDYLATYFPRTFTEICHIVKSMKNLTQYFDAISSKNSFRILSAGCGTGGDICGLIHALHTLKPQATFEVSLFDGNADALTICRKILKKLSEQENISIVIRTDIVREIHGKADFREIRESFSEQDIIITSKFLNEVLGYFPHAYYHFVSAFSKLLSEDGIMIINDVICKAYCEEFVPTYMNWDLNAAVRDKDLSSVLPLPCRANRNCNNHECYSRFPNGEYSDFTLRVICGETFADRILPKVEPQRYLIDYKNVITCRVVA